VTPLPFTDGGARIPFYALLAVFVIMEQRTRLRSWRNQEGSRADHGSLYLVIGTVSGGLLGAFALAGGVSAAAISVARWPIFVLGLVLMCTGIGLRQWSVALLGKFFTVDVRVHSDQTVIDEGPYRWVRHPSYTGMIITFAGIGLALDNWAALIVLLVVPTAGIVVRIRYEERALLDGLGEPYRRYAEGRPRLFPGLW
jgi:protein-S-isoprenylcysteine O-methyltransferase Ste14